MEVRALYGHLNCRWLRVVCAWQPWLHTMQLGTSAMGVQWGLSQQACVSTGAFLNSRCTSTAGFRALQFKPQSRYCGSTIVACNNNDSNNNDCTCTAQNKTLRYGTLDSRQENMYAFQRPANVATTSDKTWSSAGREFQTTTMGTMAPSTIRVLRRTSFRVSADIRCPLLVTDKTGTQSLGRYDGANQLKHLYTDVWQIGSFK